MKEVTRQFLDRAGEAVVAAQQLLAGGHAEFAAGRAYYAMFYTAEALLNEKGLRFRKHGGVHGAFGEHFAKTNVLDPKYHQWLLAAFEERITADYEVGETIETAQAETVIRQAREFLQTAQRYLHSEK